MEERFAEGEEKNSRLLVVVREVHEKYNVRWRQIIGCDLSRTKPCKGGKINFRNSLFVFFCETFTKHDFMTKGSFFGDAWGKF